MPFFADGSFDTVITNNVIQDTEDYRGAFCEFSRLLRPGGTYIHIENHPCFATPGCGWQRDDQGTRLHWKTDFYFARDQWLVDWRTETGMEPTISWHRTLGDIINALIGFGFRIERLVEPEPPEFWKITRPEAYESDRRKPDFIVVVGVREQTA
jgi:SAM-dependent methyltransferase